MEYTGSNFLVCANDLELAFVLDVSGPIDTLYWKTAISLIRLLIARFDVSPNSTHVSLVTFNQAPHMVFSFKDTASLNGTTINVSDFYSSQLFRDFTVV